MRSASVYAALLLGLMAHGPLHAVTIYTWTDAQGVRHFSQYPPENSEQPAKTLTYENAKPGTDGSERLRTIRDVTRDLEASRLQREEQRAKSAPPPPLPPAEPEYEPPYVIAPYPYGSPYPPPYPHPPHRRGPHKPEPDHDGKPIAPKREAGSRIMQ